MTNLQFRFLFFIIIFLELGARGWERISQYVLDGKKILLSEKRITIIALGFVVFNLFQKSPTLVMET